MVSNGTHVETNGDHAGAMARVFPEALGTLEQVDPELHAIIQDEKRRQW